MSAKKRNTGSTNSDTGANLGFEAKLWAAADALRNNMDAAEYKHVVLGLIFLKYISDAFEAKHAELEADKKSDADPEDRDEYRAASIFWVPKEVRWSYLKANAPQPTIGTLDDKIELNRRMNETLEAMARALFKSWFVDFDPVRAKAEGRDPGLPKPLADLFPDSFEDSDLGEIPKGWEVKSLDEIADFLNGLALQKYPPGAGPTLPVIKIAQLRKGDTEGADRCNTDLPPDYVINDGDVLFSWSGSLECVLWTGGKGALNQHLFKVTSAQFPKWFYYLCVHQHLPGFRHIAAGKATTMGHIQRHHLTDAKVAVPDSNVFNVADKMMATIIEQVVQRRVESRTLADLRDTLLPKLISGELRVGVDKPTRAIGCI